jgi:hypothetical protein
MLSVALDDSHLFAAVRYVARSGKAGLVTAAGGLAVVEPPFLLGEPASGSLKKLRPDVFRGVEDRADHDAIGLGRVEHEMRLKPETPIAGAQFVHGWPMRGKSARRPNVRSSPA